MPRALLLIALCATSCHTPAQADGNYYAGDRDLGHKAGALWAMQRMGVGNEGARTPPPRPTNAPPTPVALDAGTNAAGSDAGGAR